MADPQALLVAVAAAHAVEHVGLPEAQLNLAQAVVHLATAPKSNRAALGIWNARERRARRAGWARCRRTCATATTTSAASLGHGAGYEYPHDDPRGWVPQQYLPDELADRRYYEPGRHGFEAEVARRQEARRDDAEGEAPAGQADGEDPVGGSAG